ncbi:MAG: [NiFe]-hydrogenase assembly chaperone HybE [Burkholderiales bacterium]|jgi:[NiFe] hydrogenase assembly HybE family chaperone|nr:[NiFe]-hydrogenase assembly chaperone HybE [Burkholderiales bacterium]
MSDLDVSASEMLPDPSPKLCEAFKRIEQTRMQGLSFLNPNIHVEAVGFRPWDVFWLGIMLTPWTMNLFLTPREKEKWIKVGRGERLQYNFPAGAYDFIVARDDMIGDYMMCSLFSPVQQFGDHEAARLTAEYVLEALFKSDAPATTDDRPLTLQEKMEAPLSKRDFLRGRFLRSERT